VPTIKYPYQLQAVVRGVDIMRFYQERFDLLGNRNINSYQTETIADWINRLMEGHDQVTIHKVIQTAVDAVLVIVSVEDVYYDLRDMGQAPTGAEEE